VRVAEGGRDSWTKQALADAVIGGKRSEGDAVRGNGRRVLDEAQGGEDVALRLSGITWGRLRDISLSVSGGEIVGVIGLAGSEMHSLGRFVAGRTNRPWEGNVELLGQAMRPRAASLRQWVASVGYVPPGRKEEGLWVAGSIRDNVLMGRRRMLGRMRLLSRAAEWELVEGVIRDYGIRGARSPEAAVSSLSGGNQQKLLLARAYFGSPRVVVLDQPTHGIDVGARQDIYGIVRNRAANGVATVVISEDPEELAALASRVYVVRRGKIVSELENPNREIIYETLIA
jgi:ABC-type sugar transport system ATPase subunit